MTPVTPNVKLSHNKSPAPCAHTPLTPIFPRNPEILYFSFLYQPRTRKKKKKWSPPAKFMRMMLMSVSRILMTLLIEVPPSVWSFFCPAKCYRGPCQSVVSSPWRRLPSILTLKGHFPPEFWIGVRVGLFCLTAGKAFQGLVECSLTVGRKGGLLRVQPHDCAFQIDAKQKSPAHFYLCNYWCHSLFLLA